MAEKLQTIFNESIRLERNMADLYQIFQDTLIDDVGFWLRLFLEEEHHLYLIESAGDSFQSGGIFPRELVAPTVQSLLEVNSKLTLLLNEYRHHPPQEMCVLTQHLGWKSLLERPIFSWRWRNLLLQTYCEHSNY